jgi:hypothetical protein
MRKPQSFMSLHKHVLAACILALACASPARATAQVVTSLADDGGSGELRAAITAANASPGSTITFQSGLTGTITLTSALPAITTAMTIDGPGATEITVDGAQSYRVFTISATSQAVAISGLTIQDGSDAADGDGGAGIEVTAGSLTLTGCTVTANSAYFAGGGIAVAENAAATVTDCEITQNVAYNGNATYDYGFGGGIDSAGTLTLTGCTLSGNEAAVASTAATGQPGGYGGGIYNSGEATLTDCTVTANTAASTGAEESYGGGIDSAGGAMSLINCTISANTASGGGSGLANTGGTATITDSIVYDDFDYTGGADLYVPAGSLSSTHSDISGGPDTGASGNIDAEPLLAALGSYGGSTQTMALLPGSPCLGGGTNSGATTDQRGIAVPQSGRYDIGAFESRGFTLGSLGGSNQSATVDAAFATALTATVTANASSEPVTGGVISYTAPASAASATVYSNPATIGFGGSVYAEAVASGTAGGPYTLTASTGTSTATYSLTNTSLGTSLTVTRAAGNSAIGSLGYAIAAANANPGSTIIFGPGVTGTMSLTAALPAITSAVTINGPGAANLAIDGASLYRVLTIDAPLGTVVTISGLTIQDGSDQADGLGGAGIEVESGTLDLTNCTVTGNATTGFQGHGGGIESYDTINLTGCNVSNNAATGFFAAGGGIYNDGMAVITSSTISGNSAYYADAGGMVNYLSATLTGCTISNNAAGSSSGYGGGLENFASVTLANCTFSQNSAAAGSGGAFVDFGNSSITACTLTGNSASSGGGMESDGTSVITNCTLTANNAGGAGGGIDDAGNTTITNCTISGNSASTDGGGIEGNGASSLTNGIVFGNLSTSGAAGVGGTGVLATTYSDVQGGVAGTGNIDAGPLLGALSSDGGPTQLEVLHSGSPCIGAGTSDGAPATDQRGATRPDPPSIGAYDITSSRFDFNGDCKDDLLWENSQTGQLVVWDTDGWNILNGSGFATSPPPTVWQVKGVADMNGDGHPDLLWWNSQTGQLAFWELGGAAGTSLLGGGAMTSEPDTQWQLVSMADFDGDGYPDILWQNTSTGEIVIWYMNSTTIKGAAVVMNIAPVWHVAGTADFNQDGHPDILFRNAQTGALNILYMGGSEGTTIEGSSGVFETQSNPQWQIVSTGDLTGDGHPDITWHNSATGVVVIWLMGGAGGTTIESAGVATAAPPTAWNIVGVR